MRNIQVLQDVHFFTVKNDKVIKKDKSFQKYENPDVAHRIGNILLFDNEIMPNEEIQVFIYMTAKTNIYYEIHNGSLTYVVSKASKSSSILIILIGILGALAVYYFFVYLFTPNKEYIYYVLLVSSISLWGFYIYGGYAYYFDMFKVVIFSNTFMIFLPIFTTLFFKSLYKDNEQFKNYNKVLNVLLSLLFFALAYYILGNIGLFKPRYTVSNFLPILYIINILTIMYIGVRIYLKKLPFSGLFLLAYCANFIGVFVSIGFFRGFLPYNEFTFYGNMIGGAVEAILFSILLSYKMKQVYKEKDEAISATKIQGLKIDILSETIDFISHQWRQPLAQINASVIAIDDISYENNIKSKNLEKELLRIEDTTSYMSKTIDDFRNLFSQNKKEFFLLNAVILNTLSIIQKTFENNNISIDLNLQKEFYIEGAKGDISQVLLIILNNAKDAFIQRQIKNSKIKIDLFSDEEKTILKICDNAGGIEKDIKDKIFDAGFSTKDTIKGSGLGLYIAKMIIETKMKGLLYIKNINKETCFYIELSKKNI